MPQIAEVLNSIESIWIDKNSFQRIRFGVENYKDNQLVDVRVFCHNAHGEPRPTPKGIAFALTRWREFMDAIYQLEEQLELRGLIEEAPEERHVFAPREELFQTPQQELEIDEALVLGQLETFAAEEEAIIETGQPMPI